MILPKAAPVPVPADDATLVARARAGDEQAFTALYRRHARYIAGVAYRMMGSDADVDDIVQETFVAAAGSLGSINEPEHLRSWLVSIAVRNAHRRLTRKRRQRWLAWSVEKVAPARSDPVDRQRADALYEALEQIPPDLRVPWVLHTIEGQSLPDTAQLCGVSLATVKRRIAEAEARIHRRLHGG